jgi:hypothetical protein
VFEIAKNGDHYFDPSLTDDQSDVSDGDDEVVELDANRRRVHADSSGQASDAAHHGVVAGTNDQAWDRYYKTLFRPKTFPINFHPQILDSIPPNNIYGIL